MSEGRNPILLHKWAPPVYFCSAKSHPVRLQSERRLSIYHGLRTANTAASARNLLGTAEILTAERNHVGRWWEMRYRVQPREACVQLLVTVSQILSVRLRSWQAEGEFLMSVDIISTRMRSSRLPHNYLYLPRILNTCVQKFRTGFFVRKCPLNLAW